MYNYALYGAIVNRMGCNVIFEAFRQLEAWKRTLESISNAFGWI